MSGGERVAQILQEHGIRCLFTLCGGHISPILVASKKLGIRVVDMRHEASAVFAADALARLTGTVGVAAVTAGPGVTNTVTALQNARMAQSPVVVLGGAVPTLLRGRGALQDIDQLSLMKPLCKAAWRADTVQQLQQRLVRALALARSGVPGPVFLECPVDVLYPAELVREWFRKEIAGPARIYVEAHLARQFRESPVPGPRPLRIPEHTQASVRKAARRLNRAKKPVLVIGSQTMLDASLLEPLATAVRKLKIPVYLGGMARGLLGDRDPLVLRHKRRDALKGADLVLVVGFPLDFRLGYGRHIGRRAEVITVNRSRREATMNRRPPLPIKAEPATFLLDLAKNARCEPAQEWLKELREREEARDAEIRAQAAASGEGVNPLWLARQMEAALPDNSVIVVDGGDFVASAAYVMRPRGPLRWLDPGPFGTLGVGGGFAVGAALAHRGAEVWLLHGDGSSGYSLAEFDTCVRHKLPVLAVVGTDGSWAQIAREQVEVLGDAVGTELLRCDYHRVAEGYGGKGWLVRTPEEWPAALEQARAALAQGLPALINVHLSTSEFRKGSISM